MLLVVPRLTQGLSVGGEFGSSATYISEVATPGRRGFYSGFQYASIVLGQLCSLLVMIILQNLRSESQMENWGWRIPFVIGAAAGLIVMSLRRSMEESEHFKQEMARAAGPGGAEVRPRRIPRPAHDRGFHQHVPAVGHRGPATWASTCRGGRPLGR